MTTARTVAQVIAAEATSGTRAQRIADMRAIASVIQNRAQQLGVTMQDVIANTDEFNAYDNRMPPGTANLVDMAQEAIDYVAENGPTTSATFYATPATSHRLPNDLNYETETTGHEFYSDPHGRAIRTAVGTITPNQYSYAQNVANVPTPSSPTDLSSGDLAGALAAPVENLPGHWGLNPDVAPVPIEAYNQWDALASAPPVQAPTQGLLSLPAEMQATSNGFSDLAAAGPMGGNYAAPEDRFADAVPNQSQPFDRYVNTTSVPGSVDYGGYPPGSAPMIDTSAVAPNRVQSISIGGGLLGDPATLDQSRFDGLSPSVASMDASRLYSAPTTSRIGQMPSLEDSARFDPMSGLINPATNTQSFMSPSMGLLAGVAQPDPSAGLLGSPADIAGFSDAMAAQRGPTSGVNSVEHQMMQQQVEEANAKAMQERQAAMLAANPGLLTPNFSQAMNPAVPSMPTPSALTASMQDQQPTSVNAMATPEQQAAGYQQFAQSAVPSGLLSLSGNMVDLPGDWRTQPPELATVEVAEQPTIAEQATTADVPGPATTSATDQQQQQASRPAVRSNAMVQKNPGLLGSIANAINPGTIGGGLLGGFVAGPIGAVAGGLLGNTAYQSSSPGGLFGPSGWSAPTNQISGGPANISGIYGGAFSPGTYAVANNGATITAQPGGWSTYTNSYGVTNAVGPDGKIAGYFGGIFGDDKDEDAESESESTGGGFFSGW